jgi:hypothetical protein
LNNEHDIDPVTRTKTNTLVEMPYRAGQRDGLQRLADAQNDAVDHKSDGAPDSEMTSALVDGEGEQKKNTWVRTTLRDS